MPSYTVVDLDVSYSFQFKGVENVEIQFNVTQPVGRGVLRQHQLGYGRTPTSLGFYSVGAPRTVMGSVKFEF